MPRSPLIKKNSATETICNDVCSASAPEAHAFYLSVLGRTKNVTKSKQLKTLWRVLGRQVTAGSDDYRVVTIGALTEQEGGPTTQTIRNANGADYRAIITKFADEVGGATKKAPRLSNEPHEKLLSGILDLQTRQHVRLLIQENLSLRNEVNLLKHQISHTSAPIVQPHGSVVPGSDTAEPQIMTLSKSAREAIESFIDKRVLRSKRWQVNEHGAIVDAFDAEIAPPGLLDTLRQIIEALNGRTLILR